MAESTEILSISWDYLFYGLLSVVFLWRVLYLFLTPLDLVPDEAYYWDWSRQLDWGYYGKPPLIAWLNALSTSVWGVTPVAVRYTAIVFGTLSVFAIFFLGARLYGAHVGFWATVVGLTSPGSCAVSFLMTIDAPLLCCWCWAVYTLWRALESR